ncbi:hypothetical protein [uncultured Roseovarius sp.]|uniref:hypothetical protein n=1 Tax=uncultured Roseovarius sp. TaxID=293344 RepID=UPI0025EA1332|nr:hypothetical protein [uncultured Roseovarius sp.]
MILWLCCNDTAPRARGKLSTVLVDNSEDKFRGTRNFRWIQQPSLICLKNRRFDKLLYPLYKILGVVQNIENVEVFVTLT